MFQIPSHLSHKIEHIHQLGGIQTALTDYPNPGGHPGGGGRIAMFNTGSGLRFTVLIDRGGDISEAFYNQHGLAYLSANGPVPPSESYKSDNGWMRSWPGGLVTTCGPQFMGGPREEDGQHVDQHGHHSNSPAAVVAIRQPNIHQLDINREMAIEMIVRDNTVLGSCLELRRTISATLGESAIRIHDQITNVSDAVLPHNWLYHINLGYPLLDTGARFIYGGPTWLTSQPKDTPTTVEDLNALKTAPAHDTRHLTPTSSFCAMVERPANQDGIARTGLINDKLNLGFEVSYPIEQLPRLTNWHTFGKTGCYIAAIEPYSGSLVGKANDPIAAHAQGQYLEPGESRNYDVTIRVLAEKSELDQLAACDAPLELL